jgi:hypothetical protein
MGPRLRKLALTAHVAISVAWLGAIAAYLPLDIVAATSQDESTLRSVYVGMELIAWNAIVPLALTSWLTGLLMSLGTKWGLIRHYWVLISLLLTTFAVVVLLVETRVISHYGNVAANPTTSGDELRTLGDTLGHSIGGLVVLLVVLVLNMYKPRGLTPYGRRKWMDQPRIQTSSIEQEE